MKLIIFPLIFMVVFTFLAWGMDIESVDSSGNFVILQGDVSQGWFDADGHKVADENNTATGEDGVITFPVIPGGDGAWKNLPVWKNSSGSYNVYDFRNARIQADEGVGIDTSFDAASALGLSTVLAVGLSLLGIAGIKVLGFGIDGSVAKVCFIGAVLFSIWGFLSLSSLSLILSVPALGGIFWFFLTFLYTIGSLQQMAGTSGDN